MRQLVYNMITIIIIITYVFTCGERKFGNKVKKYQNILKIIVGLYRLKYTIILVFTCPYFPFKGNVRVSENRYSHML